MSNEYYRMFLDQMNLVLALDNDTSDQLETLAPHKNMYDINQPRTLAKSASLPKPVISTISNWLHYKEEENAIPQHKVDFLHMLAEN